MPDVGEGAGQVDDKSPAEEWRACECCHGLMLFAFYRIAIEGLGVQSDMRIVLRFGRTWLRQRVVFGRLLPRQSVVFGVPGSLV